MESREMCFNSEVREEVGTGAARMARKEGKIPAVIYGGELTKNLTVTVVQKEINRLYNSGAIFNTKINLQHENRVLSVIIKAISLHPITDLVTHIDFLVLTKEWHDVQVPVNFYGKESSPGLKRGGFLNKVMRNLLVRCPINAIPLSVTCDISLLVVGSKIQAKEVLIPSGCTLITPKNSIVASIIGKA